MTILAAVWSRCSKWIIAALAALAAFGAIYFRGRSTGRRVEQQKATERDLTESKQHADTIRETSDVQAEVSRLPDSDVRQRLRDKFQRD